MGNHMDRPDVKKKIRERQRDQLIRMAAKVERQKAKAQEQKAQKVK